MKVLKQYQTKAKWALGIRDSMPVLGYYNSSGPVEYWANKGKITMAPPGVNFLLQGILFPSGVRRGRSSVSFYFDDRTGSNYHFSTKGTEILFDLILSGDVDIHDDNGKRGFLGYWTCAKQGTEVALVGVEKSFAGTLLS